MVFQKSYTIDVGMLRCLTPCTVYADIAQQIELTHQIMLHWEKLLPDRIMRVSYDRLVRDQEATSRKLLKFCGLDWDPAVIQFHQTKRDVSTASQSQVSLANICVYRLQ